MSRRRGGPAISGTGFPTTDAPPLFTVVSGYLPLDVGSPFQFDPDLMDEEFEAQAVRRPPQRRR